MSDIVFGTDGAAGQAKAVAAGPAPANPAPAKPAHPNPASAVAGAVPDDMTRLLGQIVTLLGQSPGHRHVFVSDLEWLVLPALVARQARVWRRQTENGATPVIYAS